MYSYRRNNSPLGYDVLDKKYVINETEAEAVRLIYRMTLEGETAE